MGKPTSKPRPLWAARLFLLLGLALLAGCAASPTPPPQLRPAIPPSAREPCPKASPADPTAVPAEPDAERVFWAMRDIEQEGVRKACDERRAAAVAAVDTFLATIDAKPEKRSWWRRLSRR